MGGSRPNSQPAEPHGPEVTGEQERNAQAQQQLGDFGGRVAKMPALIERPQAEREMCRSRGVERDIDDRNSPPPDVEPQPRFHGRVGDVAERMIEEMREDVGEHDEAAGDAHLPHADAAQPRHARGAESKPLARTSTMAGACIAMHGQLSQDGPGHGAERTLRDAPSIGALASRDGQDTGTSPFSAMSYFGKSPPLAGLWVTTARQNATVQFTCRTIMSPLRLREGPWQFRHHALVKRAYAKSPKGGASLGPTALPNPAGPSIIKWRACGRPDGNRRSSCPQQASLL